MTGAAAGLLQPVRARYGAGLLQPVRAGYAAGLLLAVRAGYGAALLLAPGPVIRLCTGHPAGPRTRNVARLLGTRHLVQAAVTAGSGPSAESLGIGAAIDITHAASMAGLAVADRRVRRATLTDALIEIAFAAAGLSSAVPPRPWVSPR